MVVELQLALVPNSLVTAVGGVTLSTIVAADAAAAAVVDELIGSEDLAGYFVESIDLDLNRQCL